MARITWSKWLVSLLVVALFALQGPTVSLAAPGVDDVYLPIVHNVPSACPTSPTPLQPVNEAMLTSLNPEFHWDSGTFDGITSTVLQSSMTSDFAWMFEVWNSYPGKGAHSLLSFNNYQPGTQYYWRVYNKCGDINGPYSATFSFTTASGGTLPAVPTQTSPADASTGQAVPVTLKWSAVPGAIDYLVFYNTDGGGGGIFQWATSNQTILYGLSNNQIYYWWVAARNSYGIGPDSPKQTFTTAP